MVRKRWPHVFQLDGQDGFLYVAYLQSYLESFLFSRFLGTVRIGETLATARRSSEFSSHPCVE